VTGELVNPTNGFKVQGWQANASGVVDTTQPTGSISIPLGKTIPANETNAVTFRGNLDAASAAGTVFSTTIEAFDSLGAAHPIEVRFTKNAAANTWDVTLASADPDVNIPPTAPNVADTPVTFDATGQITNPALGSPLRIDVDLAAATGANTTFTVDIDVDELTQYASPGQIAAMFNDGYSAGEMLTFSVGPGGDITGIFSNGITQQIAQVALASFTNPSGLQRAGSNNYELTSNSGVPNIGTPGSGGRGAIGGGVLEGSNTELAREFTNVVIAQRGFQASSRIISTSDSMLEGLVNLLR
jgi:flagellar hook protein FlgE